MQLRLEALEQHLSRPLAALYVITSDEHLLALEAADKLRQAARKQGFTEREVLTVDRSFKWGQLLAASQAQSLFGDKKILELRIPTGKPGVEGAKALQHYAQIANQSSDTLSLITLPKLDWQAAKSAWVQALQNQAVYLDIPMIERANLPNWIAGRLALQKQSSDREGLAFIAERVEGNLLAAHQEILKLGLLHPEGKIALEDIHAAVLNVARYDVFKLSEAMLRGDCARLARMLQGLQGEGEGLPLVLWAMAEEIRTLLKLKSGQQQGRSLSDLLREYRIFGPREKLMDAALRRLNLATLQAAMREAAQIDKIIKGLRASSLSGDCWDALLQLGLKIAKP